MDLRELRTVPAHAKKCTCLFRAGKSLSRWNIKFVMICNRPLDLNVAIIGNVSAGKSTLLNALLRAKHSEVSMKRTTAGVNYFRLHTKENRFTTQDLGATNENDETKGKRTPTSLSSEWTKLMDNLKTAPATLQEISADNARLRENETGTIQEKYFDIEMEENVCSDMHPDVRLVLVDIPGINEAQSGTKYKDYLVSKWRNFDCVIVVMDGKQGVNTDDQVNLLKFVKDNQSIRWQPVIILCNKVDDPDDEEQAEMVTEARKEVETIFEVKDRDDAFSKMMQTTNMDAANIKQFLPAFLPFSASHAYFHQAVSLLSYDKFKQFDDKDLIEKYGKEYVGRVKWKRMSADERVKALYEFVTDPEGTEISSFDRLAKILNKCVGGADNQISRIVHRLNSTLAYVSAGPTSILDRVIDLLEAYQFLAKCQKNDQILSKAVADVSRRFWLQFDGFHKTSIEAVKQSPQAIAMPAALIMELQRYRELSQTFPLVQKIHEEGQIDQKLYWIGKSFVDAIVSLGRRFQPEAETQSESSVPSTGGALGANVAVSAKSASCSDTIPGGASDKVSRPLNIWEQLRPSDWVKIWNSVLLVAANPCFCILFGQEKIEIEELLHQARKSTDQALVTRGSLPADVALSDFISIPRSVYDPYHFGHLMWRLCDNLSRTNTSQGSTWLEDFSKSVLGSVDEPALELGQKAPSVSTSRMGKHSMKFFLLPAASVSSKTVHVRVEQQNSRKRVTTIEGLSSDLDIKIICKALRKNFACGGSFRKFEHGTGVIELAGDQRAKVKDFLVDQLICLPECIVLHES
jgi:translation initiation factor SUI1